MKGSKRDFYCVASPLHGTTTIAILNDDFPYSVAGKGKDILAQCGYLGQDVDSAGTKLQLPVEKAAAFPLRTVIASGRVFIMNAIPHRGLEPFLQKLG